MIPWIQHAKNKIREPTPFYYMSLVWWPTSFSHFFLKINQPTPTPLTLYPTSSSNQMGPRKKGSSPPFSFSITARLSIKKWCMIYLICTTWVVCWLFFGGFAQPVGKLGTTPFLQHAHNAFSSGRRPPMYIGIQWWHVVAPILARINKLPCTKKYTSYTRHTQDPWQCKATTPNLGPSEMQAVWPSENKRSHRSLQSSVFSSCGQLSEVIVIHHHIATPKHDCAIR